MTSALSGVRVLELGEGVAPAYCGRLLADLGAEVTKLEVAGGDRTRRQAGGYLFDALNRDKQVLPDAGDADVLARAREVDVVVESLPPGRFAALREELLRLSESGVIVVSLSVFGRQGPYAGDKGFALQAVAGSVAYRMGDPQRSPLVFPLEGGDYIGALAAANGVLLALLARRRGVPSQWVDVSSWEVIHQFFNRMALVPFGAPRPRGARAGHRSPSLYPWVTLHCQDGYVCICTLLKKHWERYAEAIGHPEWIADPELEIQRPEIPIEVKERLDAGQEEFLRTKSKAELFDFFQSLRVPYHPVNSIADILGAEQLSHRSFWREIETEDGRRLRVPGPAVRMPAAQAAPAGRA
jgi:crotonobetainyl-CoA:carnitine CoA-transferase CaiB-like acyl-CoA transferase